MEKGTIKLTVKFPEQELKDQKVILCTNQKSDKSSSENSEPTVQNLQTCDQFVSNLNCSMNVPENHEDKKEDKPAVVKEEKPLSVKEDLSSNNLLDTKSKAFNDATDSSSSSQVTNKTEKNNFSWDAKTFINLSNQQNQQLNDQQIAWIHQVYQNYLLQSMHCFSTLGFYPPSGTEYSLPQNFFPNNINNDPARELTNDQNQEVNASQNETRNQENQNNNINNNNNNNNINNNHVDDNPENLENDRDWLHNFYLLSRVIILFSIVYFYSSPLRFLTVAFLGLMIYLYHHGFFRAQQITLPNNDINAPAANIENNDQNQDDENQAPVIQHQNGPANERETATGTIVTDHDNENNDERPGALAVAWTFLSTFFASLVPD